MTKRLRSHLRDHLLPHEGNGFKPVLFTMGGVASLIVILLLVQAAYFVQTKIVFKDTDFLASVLPGVLATLTNEDRADAGIPSLIVDQDLARAAQMKADDMAARGYFAHVDPDGRQPWHWLDKAGYDYSYAGENLAVNFTDSEDVEKAWINSPTHKANIMKAQYTRVGFGVARGTYQGEETTFVVQFFATPRANAAFQVATADEPEETPAPAPATISETSIEDIPAEVPVETVNTTPAEEAPVDETQVLGVEVGTVPGQNGEAAMLETEYEARAQAEAAAAEPQNQALSFFAQVAASPTHTVIYILSALAVVVAVLLLVAIAAHLKVQYLEVAGGGLLIIMVALSLLVFNATSIEGVVLPDESQSASAVQAF